MRLSYLDPIENWIGWYSWRISFFHIVEQVFATSTMVVTLLDTRGSLFGMRVRIVLEEKGVNYEYNEQDLRKNIFMKPDMTNKINTFGWQVKTSIT